MGCCGFYLFALLCVGLKLFGLVFPLGNKCSLNNPVISHPCLPSGIDQCAFSFWERGCSFGHKLEVKL